jgi:hypothetical protein
VPKRRAFLYGGIFLLGLLSRAALYVIQPAYAHPAALMVEVGRIAHAVATRNEFADPYFAPTGPTAHHSPVYPILVGLLWKLTPYGAAALNAILFGISAVLVAILGKRYGRQREGSIAAALFCLLPVYGYTTALWGYTTLAGICILALCLWALERPAGFAYGALTGFSALCSAELALVGAALAWLCRPPRRWGWAAAGCLLVVSPWLARNQLVLGRPVLRSNLGLELRVSNNDEAQPLMSENTVMHRLHPLLSPQESALVHRTGELAYNDQALGSALAWIATHPARFTVLTLLRIREFWFPRNPLLIALTLLAGAGLFLLRARPEARVFLLVLAAYPLPHYFVQVSPHYRYPVHGILLLLSVDAASRLWTRFRPRPAASASLPNTDACRSTR